MHDTLLTKTKLEHEIIIIQLMEALGCVCSAKTPDEFKAALNRGRQVLDEVRQDLPKERLLT